MVSGTVCLLSAIVKISKAISAKDVGQRPYNLQKAHLHPPPPPWELCVQYKMNPPFFRDQLHKRKCGQTDGPPLRLDGV